MIYECAPWHYQAKNFPPHLRIGAGASHMGLFLTWLIFQNLTNEEFYDYLHQQIDLLKRCEINGSDLLFEYMEEALASEDLTDEGSAFAKAYYSGENSAYYREFCAEFNCKAMYEIDDTWENYDRIASVIDAAFCRWVSLGRPQQFPF